MLRKDYFIRAIEEFAKALAAFMQRENDEKMRDLELRSLYKQYVGRYEDLRNLSFDEIMQYAANQWETDKRMDKLEMLAKLLYAEGEYKGTALRAILHEKARLIFTYLEANSGTYSMERRQLLKQIDRQNNHTA